jgi:hypothetical protein
MPDIEVSVPLFSRMAMELVARDYIHEYSVLYYKNHDTINSPDSFSLTPEEYEDFIKVTAAKEFDDRSATEILLENFNKTAKAEGYEDLLAEKIAGLHKRLLTDKETDLKHYRAEIQSLLEEEICCRYFFQAGRLRSMIRNDSQLEKALMLF